MATVCKPRVSKVLLCDLYTVVAPLKEDAFIHRNGRTARMDSDGNSFIMLKSDDYIPEFISQDLPSFDLSKIKTVNLQTKYATVYVGLGRKDKINKVDM